MIHDHRHRRGAGLVALLAAAVLGLAGCSAVGTGSGGAAADTVTLVTHDSFWLPDEVFEVFTEQTGLTVRVVSQGDTGSLVNQLVLTKDAPLGDAVFGIDNTFASRALEAGVVVPAHLEAPALPDARAHALPGDDGALVAIDYGDVCVNIDDAWFAASDLAPPATLDDLVRPEYRSLFVTPNPVTSSPGFAFLLTTIAASGDTGWPGYWTALKANDVQVASGWTDAYQSAFTAGGGGGDRPVVVSYASSPPFTVPDGGSTPTTSALLDTCFRQVEHAGVLAGAKNPDGAALLVDFLLSDTVQQAIPGAMYMYPVSTSVALPDDWARWAPVATDPFTVDPAAVATHREEWLNRWTDLGVG
ncbi:MAG: thiamine ABC transporter substrate-binding protein [Micrococcales bacterium]|nr:thiamine ABC transporter substrate-binding protein [Micrococcales bacterium]